MWSSSFTGFARGATATTIDAHLEDFFDENPATPKSDLLRSYEALRKKRADSETSPSSVVSTYDAAFRHGQSAIVGNRTSPLAEFSLLDLPDSNITPIRLQYSPQKAISASPLGTFALPKLQASPSGGSQLEPAEPQLLPAAATAAGRELGSNSSKYSLRGRIRQGSDAAHQHEPQQDITSQKQAAGTPTRNPGTSSQQAAKAISSAHASVMEPSGTSAGAKAAQQQSTSVRVQQRQNSRHATPGGANPVAAPKPKSNALHVASSSGKDAAPAPMSAGRAKSAAGAAAVRNARANLARSPATEPTKQSKAPAVKTAQTHTGVRSKAKAKAPQLEVLGRAAASSAAQLHHMVAEYGTAVTVHRQHAMDPPAALSPAQAYLNKLQQQHGPLKEPAAAAGRPQQQQQLLQQHAWVETQPLFGFSSPSGSAAASPMGLPLEERQQQRLQRLRDLRMRRSTSTSETGELIRMLEAGEGVALGSQRPSSVPIGTSTSESSYAYGHPSTTTATDTFTQPAAAHRHRAEISATNMTPVSYHLPPPSSPSTSGLHSMASVTSPPHPLYYTTHTHDQTSLQSPEKQRQISSLQPVHGNLQGAHVQRSPQKAKASSPLKVGPREAVLIAGTGDHATAVQSAHMHDQRTAVKVSSAVQTDPQPDPDPAGAKAIWHHADQEQQQVPASEGAVVAVMAGRQEASSSPPKPAYLFSSTLTVHPSSIAGEGRNEEEGRKPQISEMIRRFRQAPPMPREQRFGGAAAAAAPPAPSMAAAAEPAAPDTDAWHSATADQVAGGTDTGATQTNSTEDEADDDDSSDANAYVDQYNREASSYRQKAYAELREQLAARSPSPQRSPGAWAPPAHGVGGRADTRGSPTKGPGEGEGGTYSAAVDGLAVALLQRSRSLLREREQIQQRIHEALHKVRPEGVTPVAPAATTAAAPSRSTKAPAAAVVSGDSPLAEGTPSWREQLKALLREVHGGKPQQQQQPMGSAGSMARDQSTPPGAQKPVASPPSPAADTSGQTLHGVSRLIDGPTTPQDSTPPTSSSSSHTSARVTPPPAGVTPFEGPASFGRSQLRSHTAAPALDGLRQELRSSLAGWMASMHSAVGSPLTADVSSSHVHAASSAVSDVPLSASDTGLGPSSAGSGEADPRNLSQEPRLDDVLGQLAARFGLREPPPASILAPQLFPGPMPTSPAGLPAGRGDAVLAGNPAEMTQSSVPAVSPVGMEAVAGSAAACESSPTGCGDVDADTSLDDKHGMPEGRALNHSDAAPHAPAADNDEVPSMFGCGEIQVQSGASPTGDSAECMGAQAHGTEVQVPLEQPRASGRKRWAVPQPGAAARLSFADNGSSSSSREAGSPTSGGSPPRSSRLSRVSIRQPGLDADQLGEAGFGDGGAGPDTHAAAAHGASGHGAAAASAAATALFRNVQGLGGDGAAAQDNGPVTAATADVCIYAGMDIQSGMSTPQSPDWASTPVHSAELASPLHPRRRHAFSPVLGMLLDGAVSGVLFGETSPGSSSRDSSVGGAEHDSRLGQKQQHNGDEQQLVRQQQQQQQQHKDCADANASSFSAATPLPASSPQPATSPVPASPAGIDLPTFMARLKALNAAEGLGGEWGMWQDDLPGSPSAQSVDSSRTFQSSGNRLGQLLDQTVSRYLFDEDSVVSGSLRASRDTVRSQLLVAGAASGGGSSMSGSHDWQQQQRQWAPGDGSITGSLLDLAARQQQQQCQGRDADPWPLPTHVQSAPSSRRGTAEEFSVEPSGGAAAASASSAPSSRRGTREEQSEGLLLRQGREQQAQFIASGDEQHVLAAEEAAVLPLPVSGASMHSPLEHLTAAQPLAATMGMEPWTRLEQDEDSVLMSESSEPAMSRVGTPVPMQPYVDQDPWHPMDPGSEPALQQDQDLHQPGGTFGQAHARPGPSDSDPSSSRGEGAQGGFTSVPTQLGVAAGPEESAAWETPVSDEAVEVPPAVDAAAAAPLLFMMEELLFGAAAGLVAGQHGSGPVAEEAVMSPVGSVPPWSELPPCSIVVLDDGDDGDGAVLSQQDEVAGSSIRHGEEQQQQRTGQEQAASSSSSMQGQAAGGEAAGSGDEEEQGQVSAGDGVEGAVLDAGITVLPGASYTTAVAESNRQQHLGEENANCSNHSSRSNTSHCDSVLQVQRDSRLHGDGEDVQQQGYEGGLQEAHEQEHSMVPAEEQQQAAALPANMQQHLQQPLNLGEQPEFEDRLHDNATAARMHKLNRTSERSPAKRRHVEEESWPGSPFETDRLLSQESPPGATHRDLQDITLTADAPLFNLGRGSEGPHRERHHARRHHAYPHAAAMAHTAAATEIPPTQVETQGGQGESARLSSHNDGVAAAGTLDMEPAAVPAHPVPEGLGSGSSDVQPDLLPRLLSAEELMFIVPIPEMQDLHGSPPWGNAAAGELPEPPAAAWKLPGAPAPAGDLSGPSAAAGGHLGPPATAAAVVGHNARPGGVASLSGGDTQLRGHGLRDQDGHFPVLLQQRQSQPAWQHQHSSQEAASEQQSQATWQQLPSYQEATALKQQQQLPEQQHQCSSTNHDTIEEPQHVAVHAATQQQYESPQWVHHGDLRATRQDAAAAAAAQIPHEQVRSCSEAMLQQQQGIHHNATQQQQQQNHHYEQHQQVGSHTQAVHQQQGIHHNATQRQQQSHHHEPHQQVHSEAEAMQQQHIHHNAMQQQLQQQQQGHHHEPEQHGRHDRSDATQQQPGQLQALPMPADSAPAMRHAAFSAFTPAAAAAMPGVPLVGFAAPATAAAASLPLLDLPGSATLMAVAMPPSTLAHLVQPAAHVAMPSASPLPSFAAATPLAQQQEAGAHSMGVPAAAHALQPPHTTSQPLPATVHGTAHGVPGAAPTYLWVQGTDAMAWSSQGQPVTFVAPARQVPAFIAASSQGSASYVAANESSSPANLAGQPLSHSPAHGAAISLHAMPAAQPAPQHAVTLSTQLQQQQQLSWAAQQQGAALPAQQQPMDVKANTQQPQGTFSIQQQQQPPLPMQQQQPVSMLHVHLQQQQLQAPAAAATNQSLRVGIPAAMTAAFASAEAEGTAHVLQHRGEDEDLVVKLLQQKIQNCVQQLRDLGQRLG